MKRNKDILDELKDLNSPLADMPVDMPYQIPEHYFSGMSKEIMKLIAATEQEDVTPNWNKQMPYSVPENYFNDLSAQILSKVNVDSLPLTKQNPFDVPTGYFNKLPAQLLEKAKADEVTQKKTKVISFNPVWRNVRWAAAAILLMGIGFGSFKLLTNKPNQTPESQLASVSGNVISDYVQQNIDDFDTDMLENNLIAANTENPKALENDINDKDIIEYLNETGWDKTEIN